MLLLRNCNELLKDCTKEVNEQYDLMGKIVCLIWIGKNSQGGEGEPIRGELATASPDIKHVPKIPRKGTPEYESLVTSLGGDPHGVFQLHWPSLVEYVTERTRQGQPPLPGLGEINPKFHVTLRKRTNGKEDNESD